MNLKKHASPATNGHPSTAPGTPTNAPTKSVKLVIRPKAQAPLPPGTPLDVLSQELPPANFNDQIPLSIIIDRVVQDAYARLVELSDTLPGSHVHARPREIDQYATDTRKQFIKAYVVSKWAKVADDVETSMNITQYLIGHNNQLTQAVEALTATKASLAGARMRNPDVLTAISILTRSTASQANLLPSIIKEAFTPQPPLTSRATRAALLEMNDIIQVRLRIWEIIPMEWSTYRIANGRVYFEAQNLVSASFSLTGREPNDQWYIIDMEFLVGVDDALQGRMSGAFPRKPPPHLWAQILPGVNSQLALHSEQPIEPVPPGSSEPGKDDVAPEVVTVPEKEVVDAPLVRAFNLLQTLSLTYQLEILLHQAMQLRPLGWGDFLKIEMGRDRRKITIRYWVRKTPFVQSRIPNMLPPPPPPMFGGTLSFSIGPPPNLKLPSQTIPAQNPHVVKLARELDERCTLEGIGRHGDKFAGSSSVPTSEPSDRAENVQLIAKWEAAPGALGIRLPTGSFDADSEHILIDANKLDCELIIKTSVRRHSKAILRHFLNQIRNGPWRRFIASPDAAVLLDDEETPTLRLTLFSDQMLYITIDARTGRFILRDSGDLAAWERGYRFVRYADRLNDNPAILLDAVVNLRFNTIVEAIEQNVLYLGLQSSRQPGFLRSELAKFGSARGYLFIKLTSFPSHFIVIIVAEEGFKYALINSRRDILDKRSTLSIADLGWLEPESMGLGPIPNDFTVSSKVLRELYAFCSARVSHTRVEQQLKTRGVPYVTIFPQNHTNQATESQSHAVPVLRVLAQDVWPQNSARVTEGILKNIRISVIDWWSERRCRVVTELKLLDAEFLVPLASASKSKSHGVISMPGLKPNTQVLYHPYTSIVSFVSADAETSIEEFVGEWDRVRRTLVVARHVAALSGKSGFEGVRLLSFDLSTVKVSYHSDYIVTVAWIPGSPDPSSNGSTGHFEAYFSKTVDNTTMDIDTNDLNPIDNPHQEVAEFLISRILDGGGEVSRRSTEDFIHLLRSTLPVLLEIDSIRRDSESSQRQGTQSVPIDFIIKGVAWFKITYGSKHILDFRVLVNGDVIILDGTSSLFQLTAAPTGPYAYEPIPGLEDIVEQVINSFAGESLHLPRNSLVVNVGRGLRCGAGVTRLATRRLHENIVKSMRRRE